MKGVMILVLALHAVSSRDIVELQLKESDCQMLIRKHGSISQAHISSPCGCNEAFNSRSPSSSTCCCTSSCSCCCFKFNSFSSNCWGKSSLPPFKCPMSGTFYRSPGPGEPPFVKIHDVVEMMMIELGDGWIFMKNARVASCLVAEPIGKAYKTLSSSSDESSDSFKEAIPKSIKLGALFCHEEEAVPTVCGIGAIWVIATCLLEAVRRSFCVDSVIRRISISILPGQPTSACRKSTSIQISWAGLHGTEARNENKIEKTKEAGTPATKKPCRWHQMREHSSWALPLFSLTFFPFLHPPL
ncbi:hypothetical protein Dimus_034337 [Dionaea muscipula]